MRPLAPRATATLDGPSRALRTLVVTAGVLSIVVCPIGGPSASAQLAFTPGTSVSGDAPQALATADLDGDGHVDLVVGSTFSGSVDVYLGDGVGGFTAAGSYDAGIPIAVVIDDMNLDGIPDIIASDILASSIEVFPGLGAGLFGVPSTTSSLGSPISLATGDFDEDGSPDVAVAEHGLHAISLLLGDGAGGLAPPVLVVSMPNPSHIIARDFDADGHSDLAVTSSVESNFGIHRGDGAGGFPFTVLYSLGVDDTLWFVASDDLDGDGLLDLVIPCPAQNSVAVYFASPFGGLYPPSILPSGGVEPERSVIADFDGDGLLDFATLHTTSNDITVHVQLEPGVYLPPVSVAAAPGGVALCGADVDEDGLVDLLRTVPTGNSIDLLVNESSPVLTTPRLIRGDVNGDGAFDLGDPITLLGHLFGGGPVLACPDAADLNDDGALDLGDAIIELQGLFTSGAGETSLQLECVYDTSADTLAPCDDPGAGCP